MLYHSWTSRYAVCFTIQGLVGMWYALPLIDLKLCGMLYHVRTSRYVNALSCMDLLVYGMISIMD